jgi:hypothetical protein
MGTDADVLSPKGLRKLPLHPMGVLRLSCPGDKCLARTLSRRSSGTLAKAGWA